nr:probable 4-coumarate--CoA ligase 1 [Dermacentor andersoni]
MSAGTVLAILFSSGSTGLPKGVVLTHGNLISHVVANWYMNDPPVLEKGDIYLAIPPIMHVGGFWSAFCYLGLGCELVLVHTWDFDVILPAIEKYRVVDVITRKPLGPEERGEICIKGPCTFLGYLNKPKETADAYEDGFLCTGEPFFVFIFFIVTAYFFPKCHNGCLTNCDMGYYSADGRIFVCSRYKELIKCMDQQVPPAEIEELLAADSQVQHVVVVGVPHEQYGEAARAFVVLWRRPEGPVEEQREADRLKQLVAEKLSHHKHLHGGVEFLESIPHTGSGKDRRQDLKNSYLRKCGQAVKNELE